MFPATDLSDQTWAVHGSSRGLIGILIFMVMTLPHLLGIMNAPVS
jgi:hypothetical protein